MPEDLSRDGDVTSSPAPTSALPRYAETFPTLTAKEIDRVRRFGRLVSYAAGDLMVETGKTSPGMFLLLSGHVAITQRDGVGHVTPVVEQGPGQFLAEVGQLSSRAALVDAHAESDVEALLIPPPGIRALMMAEADLGERIMRALILRRVGLIQTGVGGPVLIGSTNSEGMVRLQGFLSRNGQPHHLLDPRSDAEAAELIARYAPAPGDLPLAVCPNGVVLRNPSNTDLAHELGMVGERRETLYDVAVVGAGPAGLATAVYAASEGLSVVVLDSRAFGGQAGASARIENYLGFPTGISGQALAGRAFVQAQKFGAEMMIPCHIRTLDCSRADGGALVLEMENCTPVRSRTVVVASGARYRRPRIDNLERFEGRGVWYWASPIEARLCASQEVILVGGGNSAGQAAVFLSNHASKVRMMVRGKGLAESMSSYLIERIQAAPNIELMTHTEIAAMDGEDGGNLERVRWRNRLTDEETSAEIANVFLFVGADPATDWLDGCGVETDRGGFVVTGTAGDANRTAHPLESTVPGVFAVGDVRAGSVKRVGGAIGEGAQVVPALHGFIAEMANEGAPA